MGKKIFILSVLVIVMIAYIVKVELPEEEQRLLMEKWLQATTTKDLNQIEIKRDKNDPYRLIKSNPKSEFPKWVLEGKEYVPMDQVQIKSLIDLILGLKLGTSLPAKDIMDNLEVYGLKDPEITLKVVDDTNLSESIQYGKHSDYLNQRYLKHPKTNSVFLVEETLFHALNKHEDDFRQATPLADFFNEISKLSLTDSGNRKFTVEKKGSKWLITEPYKANADISSMTKLVNDLKLIKASRYHDKPKNLDDYNFTPPNLIKFGLTGTDSNKVKNTDEILISFTKKPSQSEEDNKGDKTKSDVTFLKLKSIPVVYEIAGDKFTDFNINVRDVLDKKVLNFEAISINRIVAKIGDDLFKFSKKDNTWKINGSNGDSVFIDTYIKDLATTEITDFVSGKVEDFEPNIVITLDQSGTKNKSVKFIIGAEEDRVLDYDAKQTHKGRLVVREGIKSTYWLDSNVVDKRIIPKIESLKSIQVDEPKKIKKEKQGKDK
jgi:hypothetical protein